jgi:hypothetical protein
MNPTSTVSPTPAPVFAQVFAQVSHSRDMVHSVLQMLTSREQLGVASVSRTFNATQKMITDKHIELSSGDSLGSSATVTSLKLVGSEWIYGKVAMILDRSPNVTSFDLGSATFKMESYGPNPLDALNRFITEVQSKGKRLTKFVFPELRYIAAANSAERATQYLLSNLDLRELVHLDITNAGTEVEIWERIGEASKLQIFHASVWYQQTKYLRNLPLSVQNLRYHFIQGGGNTPLFIERFRTHPINELTLGFQPLRDEDPTTRFLLEGLLPALKTIKHVKLDLCSYTCPTPPFLVDPIIAELVQSQTLETLTITGHLSLDTIQTILKRLRSSKTVRKVQFKDMSGYTSIQDHLLYLLLQYPPSVEVGINGDHNQTNLSTRKKQLDWVKFSAFPRRRQSLTAIRDSRNHRPFKDYEETAFFRLQTLNCIPKQTIIQWYREIGTPQAAIDAADREGLSSLALISAIEGIPVPEMGGPA